MVVPTKPYYPANIKTTALKTTAAAVLALSVDVAIAACPTYIRSTNSMPNAVCQIMSGSVTVANGGSVGGILATDSGSTITNITVDNGGKITITAGNDIGIVVSSASVSGGIANAGSISAKHVGIEVSNASVSGGIANSGSISAGDTGIGVGSNSSVSGGIANSGSISARQGIVVGNYYSDGSGGMPKSFSGASVSGGIANSGSIVATDAGIVVGGLDKTTAEHDEPLDPKDGFSNASVSGGIANSGSISAGTVGIIVSGFGYNDPDNGNVVFASASVSGGIANSGSISAGSTGISVMSSAGVSGGIANSGSITAVDVGIKVAGCYYDGECYSSTMSGGIANSGVISARDTGIGVFSSATVSGGIANSGSISAGNTGIAVRGEEAYVTQFVGRAQSVVTGFFSDASVLNGIANSGSISAGDTGIGVFSSATVSGGISNSGSISAKYAGIMVRDEDTAVEVAKLDKGLFSDASISGGIANSGVISVTGEQSVGIGVGSSATVNGNISNSGSIYATNGTGIAVVNNASVIGSIYNSGLISAANSMGIAVVNHGAVDLGKANNADVSSGILNSGTIQGGNGKPAIFVETNSTVPNLNIIGQSAHIIGDVDAQPTKVYINSGANFTSEGNFTVAGFIIQPGAFFNMANTIITPLLDNSGTLFIANGTTAHLVGDYSQEQGGSFQIGAQNTSSYGQLSVKDTIDFSNSGAVDVQLTPNSSFHPGDRLNNVIQGNSLKPPTNYTVTDNSFLWTFSAIPDQTMLANPAGIDLIINTNPAASGACSSTYCANAASTIMNQVYSGNSNFGPFAIQPTSADFCNAAAQATPELINENLQVTQLITRSLFDILPMRGSLSGASAGDAMLYQPGKFWLKPYAASMSQNERNTVNGYTATAYGAMLGKDIQFTDDLLLGAALAGGYDKVHGKSILNGQSITTNAYQAIIYATKNLPYNSYLAGQALLGLGINDTERFMPVVTSSAKGSYNSWFTNLSTELGLNYPINQRLVFTPVANASYLYINQAGFTETNSNLAINVQANNTNYLILGADANIAYHALTSEQQNLTLTGHAGVAVDVLNNQPSTTATFLAGGPAFTTYGIQYNDAVLRAGIGLALNKPKSPLSLNLNYDLQNGNNGYSGFFAATIKYKDVT